LGPPVVPVVPVVPLFADVLTTTVDPLLKAAVSPQQRPTTLNSAAFHWAPMPRKSPSSFVVYTVYSVSSVTGVESGTPSVTECPPITPVGTGPGKLLPTKDIAASAVIG
jgi:hypothetical protein